MGRSSPAPMAIAPLFVKPLAGVWSPVKHFDSNSGTSGSLPNQATTDWLKCGSRGAGTSV